MGVAALRHRSQFGVLPGAADLAAQPQCAADLRDQRLHGDWLSNPRAYAQSLRLLNGRWIGLGAEHDNGPSLAQTGVGQFAKEFEAGHRAHLEVADQQVETSAD